MFPRRWALVALSCVEVLTATGIMFGWSALTLALRREGQYAELCDPGEASCDDQTLRLAAVYTTGAAAIPISGVAWGPLLDMKGAKTIRLLGLAVFAIGCALFALADSRAFDAFVPAAALVSAGGMGFFFSHFVLAEHFATDHFALVHSLINCAFDASTATFTALELMHRAGAAIPHLFAGMVALAGLYAALSVEAVWAGHLEPPPKKRTADPEEEASVAERGASGGGESEGFAGEGSPEGSPEGFPEGLGSPEEKNNTRSSGGSAGAPPFGERLDESGKPFRAQIGSAAFAWVGAWALFTIYRTMLVLGSITEQMLAGGDSPPRPRADAESLVRVFNSLILVSVFLTPPFGRFVDVVGVPAGFALVNALGVFTYAALQVEPRWALYLAFLAFGCFRAWNYSLITTYVQGVFGGESFGKMYGVGVGVFAILAAAAQYPTMELVVRSGEYRALNATIAVAGAFAFAFPAFVWSRVRGGKSDGRRLSRDAREDAAA